MSEKIGITTHGPRMSNLLTLVEYHVVRTACLRDHALNRVISHKLPNWTVCPECHVDDFTHVKGCPQQNSNDDVVHRPGCKGAPFGACDCATE